MLPVAGKISNALVDNDSGADGRALDNTTNVVMAGSGTQMLSGANMTPEKISIDGAFTKSGVRKIVFDFDNIDTLDLVDNDEWYDLIVASSLEGFLSDANDDFASVNLKNAYSVFKWLNDTAAGTSTLQVSFSSVPEPAVYAAIFGALALGFAAWRKRK